MRVAFLSAGNLVPSSRFRLPFYRHLQSRGHECVILSSFPQKYDGIDWMGWRLSQLLKRSLRRLDLLRLRLGKFDAIVIDRGLFHTDDWSLERRLRKFARRIILEVDDAVFIPFPEKTAGLASLADHVIAGNDKLAGWLQPHAQALSIIPTCVDLEDYPPHPYLNTQKDSEEALTIGWIGSAGNVRMLDVCASALRHLAKKYPFTLRVVSGPGHGLAEIDLAGVNTQWIDYRTCNEIEELHRFDVGLMPLPEGDPYLEYKCNAKMVQYMTTGIPAVGSALGFNFQLVEPGTNGYLAADDASWHDHLEDLLRSAELRQQIGQAARKSMLNAYTVQSRIEQFESILQGEAPRMNPNDAIC